MGRAIGAASALVLEQELALQHERALRDHLLAGFEAALHLDEIVLFGAAHPLADGLRAEAGSAIVVVVAGTTATVSRFLPGEPDEHLESPARVDAVVRAIIELGGSYPDAIQFLQQASSSRCLDSRLAFDALPDEYDGRMTVHEEASRQDRDVPLDNDTADTVTPGSRSKRTDESS